MATRTPKPDSAETLSVDGPDGTHDVRVSNPAKPYFACQAQLSKLDIVRYFLAVAPGALNGIAGRPIVLKRFVDGACLGDRQPEPFYQKRAPADLPPFLRTVTLSFPSGRTAEELVVDNPAGLAWVVNLGCIELHPHPVTAEDLDHPNQLRVDLDPNPGVDWAAVKEVALVARAVLDEHNLTAWPKTSGSRGIHLNVPIASRWSFTEVRRAALALAREVERRVPALASSKWWKEERHGVFLDYNQNAKDRTTASAYSVRPLPDARVSAPLHWYEVSACNPADFTVLTMPARFAALGDPHAGIDTHPGSLDSLLDLAAHDQASGLGDAPWPPHFAKAAGEAPRVSPSRAKKSASAASSAKPFSEQLGEGFGAQRFRRRALKNAATDPDHAPKSDADPASKPETGPESKAAAIPKPETNSESKPEANPQSKPKANSESRPEAILESKGHGFSRAENSPPEPGASAPEVGSGKPPRNRRNPSHPLLTIAQSPDKELALQGLARWRAAHPAASQHLAPDDILTDRMRGSAYVWYRIRVNLRHVPEDQRPTQTAPDPDDDPTRALRTE